MVKQRTVIEGNSIVLTRLLRNFLATAPAAENVLQRWPVSKRVNSSRAPDDDPTLIDRIPL